MSDVALDTRSLVQNVPTLTADDLAHALAGQPSPQDLARMRHSNAIFGVRLAHVGYLYPSFQISPEARRVHPVVVRVNRLIARRPSDPALLQWWLSIHAGVSPIQLLANGSADELVCIATERLGPPH